MAAAAHAGAGVAGADRADAGRVARFAIGQHAAADRDVDIAARKPEDAGSCPGDRLRHDVAADRDLGVAVRLPGRRPRRPGPRRRPGDIGRRSPPSTAVGVHAVASPSAETAVTLPPPSHAALPSPRKRKRPSHCLCRPAPSHCRRPLHRRSRRSCCRRPSR